MQQAISSRRYNNDVVHAESSLARTAATLHRIGLGAVCAGLLGTFAHAAAAPEAHANAEQIQEVIVFGHPLVRRADDLAQPFALLRGADLQARLGSTLGETVGQEPGVQSASFGAAVGRPVIRGLDGVRVRTLEDNLDAMDASTVSGDHAVTIEPFAATQIEILKGPSTVLYGSGAIGGVVNVVTGRVPETLPERTFSGRAELRGSDGAHERTAALRLDGALGAIAWHIDTLTRDTHDYEIPGNARSRRQQADDGELVAPASRGALNNSDSDANGRAVGLAWHGGAGYVGAAYSEFETEYGLPGSAEGDVRIDLSQHRYDIVGVLDEPLPALSRLSMRLGLTRYAHDEVEPSGDIGTHFENDGTDLRVLGEHADLLGLRGAFGLQLARRKFEAIGEEAFVPASDTDSSAAFVTEALSLGATELQFGARIERVEIAAEGDRDFDFNAYALALGAVLPLAEGQSLALQLDRSARAPDAQELLANGPHLATMSFEIGDPALRREISNNANLTYGLSRPGFELVGSIYYTAFADFIYLGDAGAVEDGLPVREHRQRDAQFYGTELEATLHLHEGDAAKLDLAIFGDYVRGELDVDHDDDSDLPRIAPWRSGIALRGEFARVAGELSLTHVGRQSDVAAFERPTDGYDLLDASLTFHAEIGPTHIELFVRGSNMLDAEIRNHLSIVKDVAPAPGRSLLGGLRVRF